jgi:hypothetical protein
MNTAASLPAAGPPLVLGGVGAIAMTVSWAGAARTLRVDHQADWAIVGIAGSAAVVLAALLWILAARRMVERRLGEVLARLDVTGAVRPEAASRTAGADTVLVASAAMAYYHRQGCPLAAGKALSPAGRAAHEVAGRRPCGVCRP